MGNFHSNTMPYGIFVFVFVLFLLFLFCFGLVFAMGYFPNAAVEPLEVLVIYLKSYHGFNKKQNW